jgi:hypothetical protein
MGQSAQADFVPLQPRFQSPVAGTATLQEIRSAAA